MPGRSARRRSTVRQRDNSEHVARSEEAQPLCALRKDVSSIAGSRDQLARNVPQTLRVSEREQLGRQGPLAVRDAGGLDELHHGLIVNQ